MPGYLLHVNTVMKCPHQPLITTQPVQTRVLVNGQPVATVANIFKIVGCPFQVPFGTGTKPQPCITVKWGNIAGRVKVLNQPVLLQSGVGAGNAICQPVEQLPQGAPLVSTMLLRVSGT